MKYGLILVLFLTTAVSGLAQDEHKRGMEMFRQKQYKDAIVMFEESIASHPDWYFPIMMKGNCNMRLGKFEEAIRNFKDSLTLEPPVAEIPKINYSIAQSYQRSKQFQKAIDSYTGLLKIAPASRKFDLFFNRGQCEMAIARSDRGKANSYFSKAVVSFSEALKNKANRKELEIEASFQKAFAQHQIGNVEGGISSLEKSIQAFQDVITRNEREQRAHTYIINLQFDIVDKSRKPAKPAAYNKAVSYIERYLKSWPDDEDMIVKKGKALQGAKRYKEAITVFQTIAQRKPGDAELQFYIGSCQMADEQFTKAIASFDRALKNGMTTDPRPYSFTAHCWNKQKGGCDGDDLPIQKKAVDILERGVKATTGGSQAALKNELKVATDNLNTFTGNLRTDRENQSNVLSNIKALEGTISGNEKKLISNKEKNLALSTPELQAAIKEGEDALKRDRTALKKEYDALGKLITAARKCGGSKHYKLFDQMVNKYKERPKG